jgi:SAM-dependent methyltransferase
LHSELGELRKLRDDQLEAFDADFIPDPWWEEITHDLQRMLPGGGAQILDLGGGNGKFADRVLDLLPSAQVTVVDSSELLLSRNAPHPHKRLVCAPIERLPPAVTKTSFDLVCLHYVLHHLVAGSYRASRASQREVLMLVRNLLSDGGKISVFEDVLEGPTFDGLPSRLVHFLSSNRMLAPLLRRLGGNPAGVGVCFLSEREWLRTFDATGFRVVGRRRYYDWMTLPWPVEKLLRARADVCHYWLETSSANLAAP